MRTTQEVALNEVSLNLDDRTQLARSLETSFKSHLEDLESFRKLMELEGVRVSRIHDSRGQSEVEFLYEVARNNVAEFQVRVAHFGRYVLHAQDVVASGQSLGSLQREGSLLWRTLAAFDMRPPSNLFELLGEHEVVEIYDTQMRQIFRNLRFFECSSYSMEELLHIPLPQLFERDLNSTNILMNEIAVVFNGEQRFASMSKAGKCRAREAHSRRHLQGELEQRVISPVFDRQGRVAGVLGSIRLELDASRVSHLSSSDNENAADYPAILSV